MGMSMEDLIQAMMGGGAAQPKRAASSSGDPLADLLGSILGGGTPQRSSGAAQGGDLGGLLEAILGGAAGSSQGMPGAAPRGTAGAAGGGLMDILGAILGGGASGMQGPGTSPIVEGVAGKLGLPQGIAQMIVAFVIGKLLSGMTGGGAAAVPGATTQPRGRAATPQQGGSLDLDSLLETMGQDRSMADELAQQTGLDRQTAQRSLQEVLGMIGTQSGQGSAPAAPKQGGLDNLLDSW